MLNIYLVRHGETAWNKERKLQGQTDTSLTTKGKEQASLLAKYFSNYLLEAIYTSDLKRAFNTAEAIAKQHSMEAIIHLGLREIWLGDWQGLTWEEIEEEYPKEKELWFAREDLSATGGEPLAEAAGRAWKALGEIAQSHEKGNIIIVSHGLVIGTILCHIYGQAMINWQDYALGNTAFHKLTYANKRWQVELFNQKIHLR